jgi:hypothetical protein
MTPSTNYQMMYTEILMDPKCIRHYTTYPSTLPKTTDTLDGPPTIPRCHPIPTLLTNPSSYYNKNSH